MLTGDVSSIEVKTAVLSAVAQTGIKVRETIEVPPSAELGEKTWGIGRLSAANCRETPDHRAEMGTQILMGEIVRVLKKSTNVWFPWYWVQSADGYLAWTGGDSIRLCSQAEAEEWNNANLLIITAYESVILEAPKSDAPPVSDAILGDRVRKLEEQDGWFKVEIPDGRLGYLRADAVRDYRAWKESRQSTPEHIENTARLFLGRPYLWGGRSARGMDCSGFTKQVFQMNGVDLNRNASHQARQGRPVQLDPELSQLRKGDLLFFGKAATNGHPEQITHVGIYLENKLFIQSSEFVRITSLDPGSPLRDEYRIRGLLQARRVLPD